LYFENNNVGILLRLFDRNGICSTMAEFVDLDHLTCK